MTQREIPDQYQFSPVVVLRVYERVTQTVAVNESSFITYFNDTVNELIGKYRPGYVILPDTVYTDIDSIHAVVSIYGLYTQSIADNIIYLATGDEKKKYEFNSRSEEAYKTIYKEIMKGAGVINHSFHSGYGS